MREQPKPAHLLSPTVPTLFSINSLQIRFKSPNRYFDFLASVEKLGAHSEETKQFQYKPRSRDISPKRGNP